MTPNGLSQLQPKTVGHICFIVPTAIINPKDHRKRLLSCVSRKALLRRRIDGCNWFQAAAAPAPLQRRKSKISKLAPLTKENYRKVFEERIYKRIERAIASRIRRALHNCSYNTFSRQSVQFPWMVNMLSDGAPAVFAWYGVFYVLGEAKRWE